MKPLILFLLIAVTTACNNPAQVIPAQEANKDSTTKISDNAKPQSLVDKTMEIAKASVSGEIAEIEAYVRIILDSSSTIIIKHRAFKALQDDYPNAFTNIKNVKNTAERVEAALIRQAQIEALKEQIVELNAAKAAGK